MLHGIDLACVRGERPLFSGVGLAVRGGGWLHVRGANGAGKTSLLRLLTGLSQPSQGQVRWQGQPIAACAAAYRRELSYLGHHNALKDDLSALENIELAGALDGTRPARTDVASALHRFGLRGREELPVRFLSAGQKRRVLLARLLARKASLWVLDEPFTALDVKATALLTDVIAEHLAGGGMAVVTSHQPISVPGGEALEL